MFSSISSLNFLMELQRNMLTHLSKLNLSSTCTTSKYMPTQHKSNRAGSCITSEFQLKVNHRPKVYHGIKFGLAQPTVCREQHQPKFYPTIYFQQQFTCAWSEPIHTYWCKGTYLDRQRAAFPLYEKCNVWRWLVLSKSDWSLSAGTGPVIRVSNGDE